MFIDEVAPSRLPVLHISAMQKLKLILFFSVFARSLSAQTVDSLMRQLQEWPGSQTDKIATARGYLRDAFAADDIGLVNAWLGFLQYELDSDMEAATLFDERWLLYYWTENFAALLAEVADFDSLFKRKIIFQMPPPEDDLFRIVDQTSFDRRYELFAALQRGFLSEEEKALAALLLDHLLRTDATESGKQEQDAKASAFLKKYPDSRFKNYVWTHIYDGHAPAKYGFVGDLMFTYGRHDGAMGINFKPFWGIGGSLGFWQNRISGNLRVQVGGQEVRREFADGDYIVSPDSSATVVDVGLDAGFDLVDARRLRITPLVGLGVSFLRVGSTSPIPEIESTSLNFSTLHWLACLQIDRKLRHAPASSGRIGWTAVRFRAGYKHLNFANDMPDLGGSQIFVSLGISFFGRPAVKVKLSD